jgi:hypothetical protein
VGAILYVVLFVLGSIVLFSGAPDGDATPAKVIAVHAANDTGYVLHATGGAGAAAMIFAASAALIRSRVATWLGWFGLLAGLGALASIVFFPQALLALWLVLAGVVMLRWGPDGPAPRSVS